MNIEMNNNEAAAGRLARLATAASIICAAECAARPFALVLLPLLGIRLFDSEMLEVAMILVVLILGLGSIAYSQLTRHHSYIPAAVFLVGFMLLTTAHFALDEGSILGSVVAITGAFTIAASQFINRRKSKNCCEFHQSMEGNNG